MRSLRSVQAVLFVLVLSLSLVACAPSVSSGLEQVGVREYSLEPIPVQERWIVAVPDFAVGAGAVRIGQVDLSQQDESFFKELGSGVADIFLTEAFRSG